MSSGIDTNRSYALLVITVVIILHMMMVVVVMMMVVVVMLFLLVICIMIIGMITIFTTGNLGQLLLGQIAQNNFLDCGLLCE
jgi:uncharacterized membrane protein